MQIDAEILAGQISTLTDVPVFPWDDERQFKDQLIQDITTHRSDTIDLDVVRKPSVIWWLEYIYIFESSEFVIRLFWTMWLWINSKKCDNNSSWMLS